MKKKKEIMVVKRKVLFGKGDEDCFEGFRPNGGVNYLDRILKKFDFFERDLAENDFSYKQPVGYAAIVNKNSGKIFVYQRARRDEHYQEKRLQGRWSWGLGGHIERQDVKKASPIMISVLRELQEEVKLEGQICGLKMAGLFLKY